MGRPSRTEPLDLDNVPEPLGASDCVTSHGGISELAPTSYHGTTRRCSLAFKTILSLIKVARSCF